MYNSLINKKTMEVIKRNGQHEPVFFDKISNRIGSMCTDVLKDIDYKIVAQKYFINKWKPKQF